METFRPTDLFQIYWLRAAIAAYLFTALCRQTRRAIAAVPLHDGCFKSGAIPLAEPRIAANNARVRTCNRRESIVCRRKPEYPDRLAFDRAPQVLLPMRCFELAQLSSASRRTVVSLHHAPNHGCPTIHWLRLINRRNFFICTPNSGWRNRGAKIFSRFQY
jgi:hypothetical protein